MLGSILNACCGDEIAVSFLLIISAFSFIMLVSAGAFVLLISFLEALKSLTLEGFADSTKGPMYPFSISFFFCEMASRLSEKPPIKYL